MITFFERIFRPVFRGIERKILRPIRRGRSRRRRMLRKVQLWFRQVLFLRQPDISYYIKIGRFYIAKKMIALSVLVLVLLIYFLIISPPIPINNWFNNPNDLRANSAQAEDYSGRVNYYDEDGERLIYEGRMENGQFSGPGRLYNEDQVLVYEGEFASGEKEGRGTEFNDSGRRVYEGGFAEGRRAGTGTEYNAIGNVIYDGNFENGERSGRGQQFLFENLAYEGDFAGGVREGAGTLYRGEDDIEYTGDFANNRKNGTGELYTLDGDLLYKGDFVNDQYHGAGALYYEGTDLLAYEGEFNEGRRSGEGQQFFESGELEYEGVFADGQFHGEGTLYYESGEVLYEGQFRNGNYNGDGTLFTEAGYMEYEGAFANGLFHGSGIEYDEGENPLYEGEFRSGSWSATGTLFDLNGESFYEGYFLGGNIDPEGFLGQNLAGIEEIYGGADFLVMDESDLEETAEISAENDETAQTEAAAAGDEFASIEFNNGPEWTQQSEDQVVFSASTGLQAANDNDEIINGNGNNFDPQVLADAIQEAITEAIPQEEEEPEWLMSPATAVFNAQQMAFLVEPAELFEYDTFVKELYIWNQPLVASIYEEAVIRDEDSDDRSFRFLEVSGSTHVVHRGPYRLRFTIDDGQPETLLIEHTCDCQFVPEDRTDWVK